MTEHSQNDIYRLFALNYKNIIIDEIALEGLEGIGIDLLWRRVEKRFSCEVTEKMKKRYWSFIVNHEDITCYELPEPLPYFDIVDRFQLVDGQLDYLKDPDDYLDGPYEYKPIENEYGSCSNYHTRKKIPYSKLSKLSYEETISKYGTCMVLVASLKARWTALASHLCISNLQQLTPIHYCILELIGKSRENGQMTIGKTNLLKIVKDSKLLFYNRKLLLSLDLIRICYITQQIGDRGIKSILLRLKRFHKRSILTLPKKGMIHNLFKYLKDQPEYSERTDTIVKKGLMSQPQNKRIQKTLKIFEFYEKSETVESTQLNKKLKRRYMCLSSKSDESSNSEDESSEPVQKCQYKVGINLLTQAYERFLEAGLKGITQLELAQILGVEFYTSRTLCRLMKQKNLVREILEDVGRQRTARYIAIASTTQMESKYDEEKKKFLERLNTVKNSLDSDKTPSTSNTDQEERHVIPVNHHDNVEVIELKLIEGVPNIKKSLSKPNRNLTLRQLRYANGLIKILTEKQIVCGYQPLSNIVAKEIGEAPMDTKALKMFLQKMLQDGQMKVFKLIWPGFSQRYTIALCSPQVTATDPVIKAKCKEINIQAIHSKELQKSDDSQHSKDQKLLSRHAYPRYVKVRKFHEFITKMAYFQEGKESPRNRPQGCNYLIDVIPDMTVEFALGNINDFASLVFPDSNEVQHSLKKKIRDAPPSIASQLTNCNSFRNAIRGNLKVLALFGLIQIIDQPLTLGFDGIYYYVNRRAKIVNTTGIWPRQDADMKSLEKEFYFESMDNVYEFWNTVYQISSNTTILLASRSKSKLNPQVRLETEVAEFDTGEKPGDGKGPCGFDSGFYTDMPKLWRSLSVRTTKPTPKAKTNTVNIARLKILKKEKVKKEIKKQNTYQPPIKVHQLSKDDSLRIPKSRGKRSNDAMGNWTEMEDLMIIFCKVAVTIISPNSQPGCLRLRNLTAKDILSINDKKKTQKVCHRRAIMLQTNSSRTYEKERLLNEFKRNRNLTKKYEGLLKKLRLRYITNITKYINEARLPMLEIVWILYQITQSQSHMKQIPCIAMDLENLYKNFVINATSVHRPYNTYKAQHDSDSEVALKEIIILTVALSYNRELSVNVAKKVYTIFKNYPEPVLRKAIDELRRCQAITAKERVSSNKVTNMNIQDLAECSYKLNAGYYRKWICRLNAEFFDEVTAALNKNIPVEYIKGSPGLNCICAELEADNVLDIVTAVSPSFTSCFSQDSLAQEEQLNVLEIESKYKFKSGSISLKSQINVKKYSELFKNENLVDDFRAICRNAKINLPATEVLDANDIVINHLEEKCEKGSTFKELQEVTKWDAKTLIEKLSDLESKNILKRVGYYDNRIVLVKYAEIWSLNVDKQSFILSPWLTLDASIRTDFFFKWANVIMSKVLEMPGCSITYVSNHCELITAKSVQDMCIFLQKCKCIFMKVMKNKEVDLFSDDDVEPEILEYNPYESPDNILVFPEKNLITKYTCVRRQLLDESEEYYACY